MTMPASPDHDRQDDLPAWTITEEPPPADLEDGHDGGEFWSRADRTGLCWPWTGRVNRNGYGYFGRTTAHRVAWEIARGPIPAGHDIDHICRNRACVRPSHLEPVTRSENIRRGIGPQVLSKMWAAQTTCKQGHSFDEMNTYRPPSGRRMCRTCMNTASRDFRRRKAQKVSA